ncbi:MAG: hydroxymethylbilane synthase [Gemmatimonadota bacterium]
MSAVRLGTRGSRLALTQSGWVADRLRALNPGLEIELVEIKTSGDVIQDVPLGPEHGQAFFTKEIEDALLDGRIDLAVHSCKDLATAMPDGLVLGAIPEREDPRDVLVSRHGGLAALPDGATVGTSSPRRKGFLALARPDLTLKDQRGNVPTRLRAAEDGAVDAVVLAAAGLARLGLSDRATEMLDPAVMLPAASQGALALQIRGDDARLRDVTARLDHGPTHLAIEVERACLRRLEAGCQAPVGVLARTSADGSVTVDGAVVGPSGVVRDARAGSTDDDPSVLGVALASALLEQLGLPSLRGVGWAGPPPRTPDSGR